MADPEQITDAELFKEASTPEPAAEPEVVDPGEPAAVAEPESKPELKPEPGKEPGKEPGEAIPAWRLREETESRRQAEHRAQVLERRLAEVEARQKQAQAAETPAKDFFDDPDQATAALIERALTPYATQTREQLLYMGRMLAEQIHTPEKIRVAETAFLEQVNSGAMPPGSPQYEEVIASPNRYDAVAKWYKKHTTMAAVGDDPDAFFERKLAERMADPAFAARMLEGVRAGAAKQPSAVKLPPSLSKTTAAQGNSDGNGDLSDKSLWSFAKEAPARRQ